VSLWPLPVKSTSI